MCEATEEVDSAAKGDERTQLSKFFKIIFLKIHKNQYNKHLVFFYFSSLILYLIGGFTW